jgi:DNA-binding MarR family transcriptional regulator
MRDPIEILRDIVDQQVRSDRPDLTMRQLAVLLHTHQAESPPGVREMAAHLNLAKPNVTRALDRLEYLGFVERKPVQHDRRLIHIAMCRPGGAYVAQLDATLRAAIARPGKDA